VPALATTLLAQATRAAGGGDSPLFDWWTFAFQVGNFLVLVVLLRIFRYGRVVKAMDRRQRKIASHFEAAEQKEAEADRRAEKLKGEQQELQRKRDEMLAEARSVADRRRQELTDEARRDVDAQAKRWREELRRQQHTFAEAVRRQAGRQVCAVARRALEDLAGASLQSRVVEVFVGRLKDLPDEDRRALAEAVADSDGGPTVASAWELPADDRDRLAGAVAEALECGPDMRFETDEALLCGLELRAPGREVSWTVQGYLRDLEERLTEEIQERSAEPPEREGADEGGEEEAPSPEERTEEGEAGGEDAGAPDRKQADKGDEDGQEAAAGEDKQAGKDEATDKAVNAGKDKEAGKSEEAGKARENRSDEDGARDE